MALTDLPSEPVEPSIEKAQIVRFEISQLFGYLDHIIEFPLQDLEEPSPDVVIIEGQNGTGKTRILKMISGIARDLNFDEFRMVPFGRAKLTLSNDHFVEVIYDDGNKDFPLIVSNPYRTVRLVREKGKIPYPTELSVEIAKFREESLQYLNNIVFDIITIDRAIGGDQEVDLVHDPRTGLIHQQSKNTQHLSNKVRNFLRDAQVNYSRFFQANRLALLPRLLKRFENIETEANPQNLLDRINALIARNKDIARFGLQSDDDELETLSTFLQNPKYGVDPHAVSLLAGYVETHETRGEARDLIATRLSLFETIMDDFLVGKQVRITARSGLDITTRTGAKLTERDLSSGEFHFLYMMVAALLCERSGTILAIDEPELSLHITWQRKLVSALSACATGASPIFLLATHSTAISAAHSHCVQRLSAID